ncbi:MAG: hypothetical protein K0R37_1810 [Arthrobacter sp.]|jgi:hypothetical protein|nr:hypothetical protein [Arthrobacter sp.]
MGEVQGEALRVSVPELTFESRSFREEDAAASG